ncbi:MAG: V-type ATPase subunit, partial [Synergistaceae bacterium]|nr:V-type ATPase subunit [Synergistaceae bacterium]
MLLSAGERASASAKARVFRGRMLSREDYMRLLECETVGAIASFLSRTEAYGRYFDGTPHPEELRRWELEEIITLVPVMEEAPFGRYLGRMRSSLLDAWGARFDVEVIKRVLRMIVTGLGSREALRRWVGSAPLSLADEERLLSAQSLRDVLESVRGGPLEKVLGDPLRRVEKEARGEALFHAKTAMDSFFLTRILSEARKLPVPERRWVRR